MPLPQMVQVTLDTVEVNGLQGGVELQCCRQVTGSVWPNAVSFERDGKGKGVKG